MIARCLVPVLILAGLAAFAPAGEDAWTLFEWEEGGCAVLLPGQPVAMRGKTPEGAIHVRAVPRGERAYLVGYREILALKYHDTDTRDCLFEEEIEAVQGELGGALLSQRRVQLGEHLGVEFAIEIPGVGVYRSRLFAVGQRLYQVTVLGPVEVVESEQSQAFLDSFQLRQTRFCGSPPSGLDMAWCGTSARE